MKEVTIVVDDEMETVIRQSIDQRKSFRLDGGEVKNSFGEIVKFRSITFQVEGIPETPYRSLDSLRDCYFCGAPRSEHVGGVCPDDQ